MFAFPEELVEAVLSYSLAAPPSYPFPTRLAILLVSKRFYRIGAPLFYHTISIHSSLQLQRLLTGALRPNPLLASHIRKIIIPAIWPDAGELLCRTRSNLRSLDLTLDSTLNAQGHDSDPDEFCRGLHQLNVLSHIVVRKPNNVYLTRPKLQYVLLEITRAMQNWNYLEYVDLAFRLSDDSGGTAAILTILPIPVPVQRPRSSKLPGPVTQLTQVLSSRPNLHTFSTHLPNVWNENILRVSQNPALQRIILVDGKGDPKDGSMNDDQYPGGAGGSGIAGIGHFFAQARRHARLSELVRAGTSITRGRARTMGPTSGFQSFDVQVSSCGGASYSPSSSSARAPWEVSHSWEYYPSSLTPGSTTMAGPSHQNLPLSRSAP